MNRRKSIRFVLPELQRRIVAMTLVSIGTAVIMSICLTAVTLTILSQSLPTDGAIVQARTPGLLAQNMIWSLLLLMPAFVLIALSVTMPVIGATSRLREFVAQVAAGTATQPCKLRQTDPLQDLCDELNRATAPRRAQNEGQGAPQKAA